MRVNARVFCEEVRLSELCLRADQAIENIRRPRKLKRLVRDTGEGSGRDGELNAIGEILNNLAGRNAQDALVIKNTQLQLDSGRNEQGSLLKQRAAARAELVDAPRVQPSDDVGIEV